MDGRAARWWANGKLGAESGSAYAGDLALAFTVILGGAASEAAIPMGAHKGAWEPPISRQLAYPLMLAG